MNSEPLKTTPANEKGETAESEQKNAQKIPPHNGSNYSDIFWASLYGTLCRFGHTETRLIWMRSSAFLVVHAALIHLTVPKKSVSLEPIVLLALALVGIFLACLWSIMNHLGWINQEIWYWYAAKLRFTKVNVALPTDFWHTKAPPKPFGEIYLIVQIIIVLFIVSYSVLFGLAMFRLCVPVMWTLVSSVIVTVIALVVTFKVNRYLSKSGVSKKSFDIR